MEFLEEVKLGNLHRTFSGSSAAPNVSDQIYDNEHVPNNGSSQGEIFGLMLIEPSLMLVMSMCHSLCIASGYEFFALLSSGKAEFDLGYLFHAITVNAVFLLASTVWNEYVYAILMIIAFIFLWLFLLGWSARKFPSKFQPSLWKTFLNKEVKLQHNRLPFLDDFRGHLLQMTAVAILAVDFEIFPVRFAKTDLYGWSVMDAGVGLFVGAHGICSAESRGKSRDSLQKSIWSSIPLIVLGFVRLITVSAVGYHQVIPEYGVHWNFFFTLAFTKIISSVLDVTFPMASSGFLAISVSILHQWLLYYYEVTDYILQEERISFFDKNKEGICSLLGFVIIYFGSVKIGKLLWKPKCKVKEYLYLIFRLLCIWSVLWFGSYVLHIYVQPTSRRLANVPYCVWVMSFMCLHIAVHLSQHLILMFYCILIQISEYRAVTMESSVLWKAINYNGLFCFLLSNVLTGIVNLSMETSEASASISFLVLSIYIMAVTVISNIMFRKSLQIKFW